MRSAWGGPRASVRRSSRPRARDARAPSRDAHRSHDAARRRASHRGAERRSCGRPPHAAARRRAARRDARRPRPSRRRGRLHCKWTVSAEEADARLADTIGCRTDVAAIMHDRLSSGAAIGRYIVLSMLGEGAMGVVYAAYDPELDRKVAVKFGDQHSAGAGSRAQLMREGQAMARLSHPNVIAVHDVGVYEDRIFFAMEFVEAVTLGQWRKAQRREVREILDVFVRAG